jgi:hypothetical protein
MLSTRLVVFCSALSLACSSTTDESPQASGGCGAQAGSSVSGGTCTAGGCTSAAGGGSGGTSAGSGGSAGSDGGAGGATISEWQQANLTHFTSYPDPGSEECIEYNGCMWAGYFAALPDQQTDEWVMEHNIAAVHSKDFAAYELKTMRLRKDGDEIDVVVYDMCSDDDCSGCCTANSAETGFLIDIEEYTYQRFGHGDGIVEWACLDCE